MSVRLFQSHCVFTVLFAVATTTMVGCQATRNRVAVLPGMGWLASEEPSLSQWDSGSASEELSTPSQNATPRSSAGALAETGTSSAATNSTAVAGSYPNTGYPAYANEQTPTVEKTRHPYPKYNTSSTSDTGTDSYADTSTVGGTQTGFYDEQYRDGKDRKSTEPYEYGSTTRGDYDKYDQRQPEAGSNSYDSVDSRFTGGYQDYSKDATRESANSLSDASSNDFSASQQQADRYVNQAFENYDQPSRDTMQDITAPTSNSMYDNLRGTGRSVEEGYNQIRQNIAQENRNQLNAYSNAAQDYSTGVRDSARQAVDDKRNETSEIVNQYASEARDQAINTGSAIRQGVQDTYNQYLDEAIDHDAQSSIDANRQSSANAYDQARQYTQDAADFGRDAEFARNALDNTAADANPLDGRDGSAESYDSPYGTSSATRPTTGSAHDNPRRLGQPWRPGSTSDYPRSSDQSGTTRRAYRAIVPASFQNPQAVRDINSTSSGDHLEPVSTSTTQRVAPTYR